MTYFWTIICFIVKKFVNRTVLYTCTEDCCIPVISSLIISKFLEVRRQFLNVGLGVPLIIVASDLQSCVSAVSNGWLNMIAFLRLGFLKSVILFCKYREHKKSITTIDAPIKLSPLCETTAKTFGLNNSGRELRRSLACFITSRTCSGLPFGTSSLWVMSLT